MRMTLALLCAALLSAHSAQAAAPVPLAAFVHEDQFSNPRLAPDGKHIAITTRVPSGDRFIPVLTMYSLPDMKMTGAFRMPAFEVPVTYSWVTPTRLAMETGREFGSRERPQATGEVIAFNIDGSGQDYLYGHNMFLRSKRGKRYGDDHGYGYIQAVPRDRNGRLFLTSHAWEGKHSMLYDVNTLGAARTLLADVPLPDLNFVMQSDGKPRFAIGSDVHGRAVQFRRDDASGSWVRLEKDIGRSYRPFLFNATDTEFAATLSSDGGPSKLVRENLATGTRTVLFEDPTGDVGNIEFDARSLIPFAASSSVGRPKMRYFDTASEDARLHKTLSAQFPDHFVSIADDSDDGKWVLFRIASDRDPGSYYLYERATMNATLLFSSHEAIDPELMAERRPISFKARDGLELHGFLTIPPGAGTTRPPLVVLPHGGPHGPYDNWFFDEDAQFLASRGYAVLQVNFRGSGGRGVNFRESGHREWAGKIMNDLVDATRWTIAQGHADGERVCAYGASFGGYASLMLAALEPSLYKCAVGYVGVYDLKLLGKARNDRDDEGRANAFRRFVGDKADRERDSPVNLAAKIKAPVLLIHGGNDKIAPVEHAHAMRAALTAAGRPPEWFLAPNEGHGFYDTANRTAFYEKLEAFLGRHIGNAPAAR